MIQLMSCTQIGANPSDEPVKIITIHNQQYVLPYYLQS